MLNPNVIITFMFLISTFHYVSTSHSAEELALLAEMELNIYNALLKNQVIKERAIPLFQEFLKDFEESTLRLAETLQNGKALGVLVADNPLAAFRMIRRYALMHRPIKKELKKNNFRDLYIKTTGKLRRMESWEWPSILDLEDAMTALIRIHHVYDLELDEFSNGKIWGIQTPIELSGRQCLEIGEFALKIKQYTSAILWMETALYKTLKSEHIIAVDEIQKSLNLTMH